jgi:hypothetical protein
MRSTLDVCTKKCESKEEILVTQVLMYQVVIWDHDFMPAVLFCVCCGLPPVKREAAQAGASFSALLLRSRGATLGNKAKGAGGE